MGQQEDQGYQSSLSSPNESQMKRTGWVFRVSLFHFCFQTTFPICLKRGGSLESLWLTFVSNVKSHFQSVHFRPPAASQKHLLTVQKATSDPFSQSLPESLLGIFYNTTSSSDKSELVNADMEMLAGAVKNFGGDLSDSIRSNASTRSKVISIKIPPSA